MKIAIIGGGAAGLMCACRLAGIDNGHEVIVIEKNSETGKKLLLTGNSRCNITNLVDVQEFLESVPRNAKFLSSSLYRFSPSDTVEFFEQLGVRVKVEDNNRVFPLVGGAQAIKQVMEDFAKSKGVKFWLGADVDEVIKKDVGFDVEIKGRIEYSDRVIIATGGVSFPMTGSGGAGFDFARKLGHSVVSPRASLCGLMLAKSTGVHGVTINCGVEILSSGEMSDGIMAKSKFTPLTKREVGNLLFTKSGVSGPCIFRSVARFSGHSIKRHWLQIDFVPSLTHGTLEEDVLQYIADNPRKQILSLVREYVPESVADFIISVTTLNESLVIGQITKEERKNVVNALKALRVVIKDFESIDGATITRGGVCVNEVNPKTMESKLVADLYFIGEVLDVDALSGGFNLQIAFSTAVACADAL